MSHKMPSWLVSTYVVTKHFAIAWPHFVSKLGYKVDSCETTLNGQLLTPIQTGEVRYGRGSVWVTTGVLPDPEWLPYFLGTVGNPGFPKDYEIYLLAVEGRLNNK